MAPTKPTGSAGKTETATQNPESTPGTGAGSQSQTLDREEPVSWVYKLNKEALTAMLSGLGLEATGTVEELRRRLTKFLRDRAAETVVPAEEPVTSAPVPSSVSVPVPSVPVQTQVLATSAPVSTPERSSRPVRVQDWRVTFNGKGDPVAFLERVEELCDSDGVDADQLLPHLPGLLQGEAAAWFRNNRQRWCDWKGFVTDFRLFYFPVSYQEDLEVEISRRLQRPTEPVTTYLTELQTLLRRHGNLQPEQQLSWMYRNLLPEYRLYLKRPELTDVATLLRSVRELEALLREQTMPTGRADKYTAPADVPASRPAVRPTPPERATSSKTFTIDLGGEPVQPPPIPPNYRQLPEESDHRPHVTVQIRGESYTALVDTGATVSFIGDYLRDKCYRHLRPVTPTVQSARMANGQVEAITEAYWISLTMGTTAIQGKFHHLPHLSSDIVLGIDILRRYPFTIDLEGGSASLRAPAAVDGVKSTPPHPTLQVSENPPLTLSVGKDETTPEDLLASDGAPGCAWYTKMRQEVEKNPAAYPDYSIQGDRLHRHSEDRTDSAEPELSDPWKLCVPKPARAAVLRECHNHPTAGHLGIGKTTAYLALRYYWPGMSREAAQYVRNCPSCQRPKTPQQQPPGKTYPAPNRQPWESVSTDRVGPLPRSNRGNGDVAVIQDRSTKWVQGRTVRKATARTEARPPSSQPAAPALRLERPVPKPSKLRSPREGAPEPSTRNCDLASITVPARTPAPGPSNVEAKPYGCDPQAPRLPRPESLCWRCGVPGHSRGDCRAPMVLFCSRCGTLGLLSRECPCPRPPTTPLPRAADPPHRSTPESPELPATPERTPCPLCGRRRRQRRHHRR
jgi:hypothetical protein